jgi:hypothetical protein
MLQDHRDITGARFFEVDPILHSVDADVHVAADCRVEEPVDIGYGAYWDRAVANLAQHRDELLDRGEVRTDGRHDIAFDAEVFSCAAVGHVIEERRRNRGQQLVPTFDRPEDAYVVLTAVRIGAPECSGCAVDNLQQIAIDSPMSNATQAVQ